MTNVYSTKTAIALLPYIKSLISDSKYQQIACLGQKIQDNSLYFVY